jgi:hypothetical protein
MNPHVRKLSSKKRLEPTLTSGLTKKEVVNGKLMALPEYIRNRIRRFESEGVFASNTEKICDRIDNKRAGIASLRDNINELKEERNRLIKDNASRSDIWEAESRLARKEEDFNRLREDVRALNAMLTLRKRE